MNDDLLVRLFGRHFPDPVSAIRRFDAHLADVQLPFDLKSQLRELVFPPQPAVPNGVPSIIYYFVPNSRRGSDQTTPKDPLHPSFLNVCDGIGLNLGCPVRLLHALDALARLAPTDQKSPRAGLRNSHEHLSTVEELLWLTGWKTSSAVRRGGQFHGVSGDVDWAFDVCGFPIFLEAKFRRSDWPRLSEKDSFLVAGGGFLANAVHKFPQPPQIPALHVVGVTTFHNVTEEIVHDIGQELQAAPQIHAVVIRSLIQMTHVLSLSLEIRDRMLGLLSVPSVSDFPVNHSVFFHREHRDKRVTARPPRESKSPTSNVVCWPLKPMGDVPFSIPEPGIYRLNISSRESNGEPHFQVVPKYS